MKDTHQLLKEYQAKRQKKSIKARKKNKNVHIESNWDKLEAKWAESSENDLKVPKLRNTSKVGVFSEIYGAEARMQSYRPDSRPTQDLQLGNRVILTYQYIPTPLYPVWETEHECVGTIIKIGDNRTRVDWDNGRTYQYPMSALDHAPMGDTRLASNKAILDYCGTTAVIDPNTAFRIYKQGSMDRLKCKSMLDWHENVDRAAELIDR